MDAVVRPKQDPAADGHQARIHDRRAIVVRQHEWARCARSQVGEQPGPRLGAVTHPQLVAVHAIVGGEQDAPVQCRESVVPEHRVLERRLVVRGDVLDHPGARLRAVRPPQRRTVDAIIGSQVGHSRDGRGGGARVDPGQAPDESTLEWQDKRRSIPVLEVVKDRLTRGVRLTCHRLGFTVESCRDVPQVGRPIDRPVRAPDARSPSIGRRHDRDPGLGQVGSAADDRLEVRDRTRQLDGASARGGPIAGPESCHRGRIRCHEQGSARGRHPVVHADRWSGPEHLDLRPRWSGLKVHQEVGAGHGAVGGPWLLSVDAIIHEEQGPPRELDGIARPCAPPGVPPRPDVRDAAGAPGGAVGAPELGPVHPVVRTEDHPVIHAGEPHGLGTRLARPHIEESGASRNGCRRSTRAPCRAVRHRSPAASGRQPRRPIGPWVRVPSAASAAGAFHPASHP